MSKRKLEYDAALGGLAKLPSHVPTYRYAASVLREISDLVKVNKQPSNTKLVFQTLPTHMRRRAMSHHPKRLPRKYREIHKSQMAKAGNPRLSKCPSRKYRRRPKNLLCEYLRRQRRFIWLETHIWHAKRFHMIDRWGYRLAYSSCNKTFRACYRASVNHCLLQDISYLVCLELRGSENLLKAGFARLSSTKCGLTLSAITYLDGKREGNIELFGMDQFPAGALGRASFMWRPVLEDETERTLWLWVHPGAHSRVLEELIKVFQLVSQKTNKVPIETDMPETDVTKTEKSLNGNEIKKATKSLEKSELRQKFMTRTIAYERIKRYVNKDRTVMLQDLKDNINRYRLTGQLTYCVLAAALKSYAAKGTKTMNWFKTLTNEKPIYAKAHTCQTALWQRVGELYESVEMTSNMIIGLNVVDPRLQRPRKRNKALPNSDPDKIIDSNERLIMDAGILPVSALWQSCIRDQLCKQMLSTQAYCDLRAEQSIVPGASCKFESDLQPVPLLLIHRPGILHAHNQCFGYSSGWDIIAPAGYGMIIWMTLIMWGAKPGGLREFETISREVGNEQHLPDTLIGLQQAVQKVAQLRSGYFGQPPNKRCNYRKFAIVSPFRVPFTELVRDWLPHANTNNTKLNASSYYVLRDMELLKSLINCIRYSYAPFPNESELPRNCLIQIQISLIKDGVFRENALICLPTNDDFKRQLELTQCLVRGPIYTEPLRSDPNEKKRRILRNQHKRLLKRLRGKRVRTKHKLQEKATKLVHVPPANTSHIVAKYFKEMSNLWVPENATETLYSVRKQCKREVVGYVTSAGFSFTKGLVTGVGYVTPEGLKKMLHVCRSVTTHIYQPIVCLVRDTESRIYKFAQLRLNLAINMPPY